MLNLKKIRIIAQMVSMATKNSRFGPNWLCYKCMSESWSEGSVNMSIDRCKIVTSTPQNE